MMGIMRKFRQFGCIRMYRYGAFSKNSNNMQLQYHPDIECLPSYLPQ